MGLGRCHPWRPGTFARTRPAESRCDLSGRGGVIITVIRIGLYLLLPCLALVVFVAAASGSGHHTAFATFSRVGALSIPTPSGFHHRRFAEGVVISEGSGRILPLIQGVLPAYPRRAELAVFRGVSHGRPGLLKLPLRLSDLEEGSGGYSRLWGNAFVLGHQTYFVQVWLGRHAPASDRSAVLSALQAIKRR
jgi:hypothetical protein